MPPNGTRCQRSSDPHRSQYILNPRAINTGTNFPGRYTSGSSRAWLWREGRRVGDKVQIIVNDDDFTGIDIHAQEDLDLAEAAIKIRNKVDQ